MSKGRFLGVLIPNLDDFFGSHPPGGVHGRKGGEMITNYEVEVV